MEAPHVIRNIAAFLSFADFIHVLSVSTEMKKLNENEDLWKHIYYSTFSSDPLFQRDSWQKTCMIAFIMKRDEKRAQFWKLSKLNNFLKGCKGSGTSMMTLAITPSCNIQNVAKNLLEEFQNNVYSRAGRLSRLGCITSCQQRLKLYKAIPKNGLVIFAGSYVTEDGYEKKCVYDIVPLIPNSISLVCLDNKFHTQPLEMCLEESPNWDAVSASALSRFFTCFNSSSGNFVVGVEQVMDMLHMGYLCTVIVHDQYNMRRIFDTRTATTQDMNLRYSDAVEPTNQQEVSSELVVDWLVENISNLHYCLDIVNDKSELFNEFILISGGIALWMWD